MKTTRDTGVMNRAPWTARVRGAGKTSGRARGSRSACPWPLLAALLLAGVGGPSPAAQQTNAPPRLETNAPARLDYSSFRIITERNIFNANRSGRSSRGREARRPARVEAFTLVGTLSYEKGPFAFFDGTSSDFKKALPLEGAIAGYKIKDINGHGVELEAGANRIELRVGMQMRREDEGEWQVRAHSETYPSASSASAGGTTAGQSGGSGGSAELSEVVKRLMQQREKESK
jgi:hypothetical protein